MESAQQPAQQQQQQQQMHVCRLCDKILSSSSSLDRHMLTHSGERPFVCKRCHMTFTTNGNMHRHMRTHLHKDSIARQQQEQQQLKSLCASSTSLSSTSPITTNSTALLSSAATCSPATTPKLQLQPIAAPNHLKPTLATTSSASSKQIIAPAGAGTSSAQATAASQEEVTNAAYLAAAAAAASGNQSLISLLEQQQQVAGLNPAAAVAAAAALLLDPLDQQQHSGAGSSSSPSALQQVSARTTATGRSISRRDQQQHDIAQSFVSALLNQQLVAALTGKQQPSLVAPHESAFGTSKRKASAGDLNNNAPATGNRNSAASLAEALLAQQQQQHHPHHRQLSSSISSGESSTSINHPEQLHQQHLSAMPESQAANYLCQQQQQLDPKSLMLNAIRGDQLGLESVKAVMLAAAAAAAAAAASQQQQQQQFQTNQCSFNPRVFTPETQQMVAANSLANSNFDHHDNTSQISLGTSGTHLLSASNPNSINIVTKSEFLDETSDISSGIPEHTTNLLQIHHQHHHHHHHQSLKNESDESRELSPNNNLQQRLRGKRRKQVNPRSTRSVAQAHLDQQSEQQRQQQEEQQQQQPLTTAATSLASEGDDNDVSDDNDDSRSTDLQENTNSSSINFSHHQTIFNEEQFTQNDDKFELTSQSRLNDEDHDIEHQEDISQSYVKTANPNAARKGGKRNRHCYKCKLCTYSSVDRCTLVRHLRIHSGERPYICGICRYAFTTKANCERHVRKRHKKQYNSLGGAGGGGIKGSNGGGRSLIITDHSNHQTIPVKVNPVAAQTISQTLQRIQENPFDSFNQVDLAGQALDLSCRFQP